MRTRRDLTWDAFDHLHARALQGLDLIGIVGKEPNFPDAERFQYLSRKGEISLIRFKSETLVGFDRVKSGILQLVRLQFRHKANAAALLLFIDEDAGPGFTNQGQRKLQLLAAIATERVEHVTRHTLRMHSHQGRRRLYVAHHQSYSLFYAPVTVRPDVVTKSINAKISPAGRKIRGGHLLYLRFVHSFIIAVRHTGLLKSRVRSEISG